MTAKIASIHALGALLIAGLARRLHGGCECVLQRSGPEFPGQVRLVGKQCVVSFGLEVLAADGHRLDRIACCHSACVVGLEQGCAERLAAKNRSLLIYRVAFVTVRSGASLVLEFPGQDVGLGGDQICERAAGGAEQLLRGIDTGGVAAPLPKIPLLVSAPVDGIAYRSRKIGPAVIGMLSSPW